MALNPKVLEDELFRQSEAAANGQTITYGDFVSAMEKYALGIKNPPPAGVVPAAAILKNLLDTIPTTPPLPIATPIIKLAVSLFALSIGFAVPVGKGLIFPTIPPSGAPAIDAILAQPNSREQVASQLANAIHTFMITGIYDANGKAPNADLPSGLPGYVPWG